VFHTLNIPIDYTIDYAGLSAASLKPYQLLLIFRDGENSGHGSPAYVRRGMRDVNQRNSITHEI